MSKISYRKGVSLILDLTFVCCSYRVTLNQNEKTQDPEEQATALKACHQRCADRTLKTLEKNGSVFIKLGQHLVLAEFLMVLKCFANYSIERPELSPTTGMDEDLHTPPGQMSCVVF